MTISPSPTFAPPWAAVTRLIWLAMAIALFGVFAIGLAQYARVPPWVDWPTRDSGCQLNVMTTNDLRLMTEVGYPVALVAGLVLGTSIVARLSLALTGVAIFALRPNDRMAWWVSLLLLTALHEGITQLGPLQIVLNYQVDILY